MGAGAHRLAVDRTDVHGMEALRDEGFELVEGQRLLELARSVKCPEEIDCMRDSLAVADIAMSRMREALRPGVTENELWAELHHANIAHGGEWIETRLLSSGPRTNPWFQESSDRRIESGELVSFDTDMIGPYGYCADVSRTFLCGPAHRLQHSGGSTRWRPNRWPTTATCCDRGALSANSASARGRYRRAMSIRTTAACCTESAWSMNGRRSAPIRTILWHRTACWCQA